MKDAELIAHGAKYDGVWSWARADSSGWTARSGKWMLWPEGEEALSAWRIIGELTRAGKLGIQAKISCRAQRELVGERLICVYTADSDDLPDLQRVVDLLRNHLNPKHRLIYKEESMTHAGLYQDANRRVSKWYVHPGERIIRGVKGYKPVHEGE